jgi:hypothetical protein
MPSRSDPRVPDIRVELADLRARGVSIEAYGAPGAMPTAH